MDADLELLRDFRTESLEHMGELEPLFLEVEEMRVRDGELAYRSEMTDALLSLDFLSGVCKTETTTLGILDVPRLREYEVPTAGA